MIFYWWMLLQIIGENLPISSSGHVQLLLNFYKTNLEVLSFIEIQSFDYALQACNAVIFFFYFFTMWWQMIVQRPIAVRSLLDKQVWKKNIVPVVLFGLVADVMTVLFWVFDIKALLSLPLSFGFFMTGLILYSLRYTSERKNMNVWSLHNAIVVGCAQGLALLSGISRFALTMAALQWLGYQRSKAFAISFLVQWPLIVAGSIKGCLALQDSIILQTVLTVPFLVAMVAAVICSYGVLKIVGTIVDKNSLWKFSYYMIILSIVTMFLSV